MMKSIIERNDVAAFSIGVREPINSNGLALIIRLDRHELLKIILDLKQFDASHIFRDGWSILHYVTRRKSWKCARLLLQRGANPIEAGARQFSYITPIYIAVVNQTEEILTDMLEYCSVESINKKHPKRGTLLRNAIVDNLKNAAERLIEHGAKRDGLEDISIPVWCEHIFTRRQNTRRASQIVILMLKHQRIVCKDLALMIGKVVWETRFDSGWLGEIK